MDNISEMIKKNAKKLTFFNCLLQSTHPWKDRKTICIVFAWDKKINEQLKEFREFACLEKILKKQKVEMAFISGLIFERKDDKESKQGNRTNDVWKKIIQGMIELIIEEHNELKRINNPVNT